MEAAPPPPSPPPAAEATAESIPTPAATPPSKGFGLKKWRRIRRGGDPGSDPAGSADNSQIHKRRLSLPGPIKPRELHGGRDGDGDRDGDSSLCIASDVASTEAVVTGVLDPELVHLVASGGFSVGADSDNSEDRSSKSSTAASAPRGRGKGRGSGHAAQQRGRGRCGGVDAIKKFRGDRVSKENSQSSMESDLRSFVRWGGSNGKQSEVSVNDDGENSDGAHTGEDYKENGRAGGDGRQEFDEDLREEESVRKSGSGRHRTDLDPFLESIVLLQAAQEALETEIQKFGEIGKEATLTDTNGLQERIEGSNSPELERRFLELDQKIKQLERKLEEASATIKLKESRVLELESILNKTPLLKKETKKETDSSGVPTLQENCNETELELEGLLMKRIEAEVEYMITSGATLTWKVQTEDQIAFLEEQKSLVKDHAHMILKLTDAENKATMLKKHAEELEARCKDLLGTEEVLKLQSKVCRSSVCCFTQLVMLSIALWWFLTNLLLPSEGTVPT